MLSVWEVSLARPTRDIDLLGHVANDIDRIVAVVKEVCRQEVEPDGLDFDPDSVGGADRRGGGVRRGAGAVPGASGNGSGRYANR